MFTLSHLIFKLKQNDNINLDNKKCIGILNKNKIHKHHDVVILYI